MRGSSCISQWICVIVLGTMTLDSCAFTTTSASGSPVIHTRELLLDNSAFPAGWDPVPCGSACDRAERFSQSNRSFGRIRSGRAGLVIQDVIASGSTGVAHDEYQHWKQVDFKTLAPPNETLLPPIMISYRSPIADEQYLGCGVEEIPACQAIRRYGSYFISLYFHIDDGSGEGMPITAIEPILRALDMRVSEKLGIPLPPTAPTSTP